MARGFLTACEVRSYYITTKSYITTEHYIQAGSVYMQCRLRWKVGGESDGARFLIDLDSDWSPSNR